MPLVLRALRTLEEPGRKVSSWVVQPSLPARISMGWPEADRPLLQALGPRQDLVLKVRGLHAFPER